MIKNLHDLYIHQIQDLKSAESQILEALPKMIQRAQSSELREAFEHHLEETKKQNQRLDVILQRHGIPGQSETCQAAKGIIEEGSHLMSELTGDATDPGLITSAQRFEHYEIAAYGTAAEYADVLDYGEDKKLLEETLDEEGNANKKLTKLATGGFFGSGVNKEAVATA